MLPEKNSVAKSRTPESLGMALSVDSGMSAFPPIMRAKRKYLLHLRSGALDPNVWSGRALQEVSSIWRMRSCINVSGRSRPCACELISGQASMGRLGHQCSHAPGRPILHLVFILSQTSAYKTFFETQGTSLVGPYSWFGVCRRANFRHETVPRRVGLIDAPPR